MQWWDSVLLPMRPGPRLLPPNSLELLIRTVRQSVFGTNHLFKSYELLHVLLDHKRHCGLFVKPFDSNPKHMAEWSLSSSYNTL